MKSLSKKGQAAFDQLGNLAKGVAVLAIVLIITFLIIAQGKSQIVSVEGINTSDASTFTAAYNATGTLQSAVDDIPGWVPIVIIASIGVVLLGIVQMYRR